MKHLFQAFSLLFVLIMAQQGAVVHEIDHVSLAHSAGVHVESGGTADNTCALCPAFAQVVTPTFSHSFPLPHIVRSSLQPSAEPRYSVIDAAIPTPRSRGPPVRS